MMVRTDPLKVTTQFGRKFLPKIDKTSKFVPALAEEGFRLVICGCGFDGVEPVTVNNASAVPPPGWGFVTATTKLPACERSDELRVMVNSPLAPIVTVRFALLAVTVEDPRK